MGNSNQSDEGFLSYKRITKEIMPTDHSESPNENLLRLTIHETEQPDMFQISNYNIQPPVLILCNETFQGNFVLITLENNEAPEKFFLTFLGDNVIAKAELIESDTNGIIVKGIISGDVQPMKAEAR